MDYITILGFAAAILTTASFLPQVIKTWRTKSTRDISLGTFIVLSIGITLWLIYGILIDSLPIIIANTVTIFLTLIIVAFKIKYG